MKQHIPASVAVITGASSGIGEATALVLAREGFRTFLVARRGERLKKLARRIASEGGEACPVAADLSREEECRRVYRLIRRRSAGIDVLINNAGQGWYGFADAMDWTTARKLLAVNVGATTQLTLMCMRDMRRRRSGHIIIIGSIAGGIPSQGVALYGATKAFLDNFATALHRELKGTGINVSVMRLGPVKTEFGRAARQRPHGLAVPTERIGVSADVVAHHILRLIRRPRRVAYIPAWLWIVPWAELAFGWLIDRLGPLLLARYRDPSRT